MEGDVKVVVLDIETISMKEWPWASAWIAGVYDEGSQSFHQKEEVLRYYILTGLPDSLSSPWDLGGFVRVGKGFLPRVVYRALKHREQVEALFKGQKVIFPPSSQTLDSLGAFHEDRMLRERLRWADVLVAHNVDFEASILRAHGYPLPDLYCTMRESTNLCGLTRTVYSWGCGTMNATLSPQSGQNLRKPPEFSFPTARKRKDTTIPFMM